MATIFDNINNLYDKTGYLARYGSDLYITIIVIVLFFIAISYYQIMIRIQPIKADWVKQRCNPAVIPFAGMIYKPKGKTTFEATSDNFAQCTQTTLQNISGYALQPFTYMVSLINEVFEELANSAQAIRAQINNVRDSVEGVGTDVMGRSLNILSPVQQMLVSTKSAFGKTAGIGTATIYSLYAAFLALKALIGSIIQFIIVILVGLAAAVILLWIIPFTWPVAAIGTAIFVTFAAIMSYILIVYSRSMHGRTNSKIPSKPSCLDEDTELLFQDGTIKKVKNIVVEDFGKNLICGSTLLGMVESSSTGHNFYNVDGIIVTGSHRLIQRDISGIERHIRIDQLNFPKVNYDSRKRQTLYCPITDTGRFKLNGLYWADWIDLESKDISILSRYYQCENTRLAVNKRVCSGVSCDTKIDLYNKTKMPISDIKVNDILVNDVQVIAKVKMLPLNRWTHIALSEKRAFSKNGCLECLMVEGKNYSSKSYIKHTGLMNHLVTDKGFFFIDNCRILDFDQSSDIPQMLTCRI